MNGSRWRPSERKKTDEATLSYDMRCILQLKAALGEASGRTTRRDSANLWI